ncbi:MAG: S-layer homology domain-containing protein, partial [Oscillospiraceae bacterium]|nr:S-layer homology domain-containing protein [Oscillospiraceae bacterium]
YRALQNQSLLLEEKGDRRMAVDEVLSQYHDFTTVADYAREAVSALIGAGLVNGKNGLIEPTDFTTRAEVAVLLRRILEYTK